MIKRRKFSLALGAALLASTSLMACGTDDEKKEDPIGPTPEECRDPEQCLDLVICNSGDAFVACMCVTDINECHSNPKCNGIGTCEYTCSREAGTCGYKACEGVAACDSEGECVASELDDDGDYDGDGIPNGIEKVTPGLDPCLADSDGDTVPDGVEDLNRDGKFDIELGETDPTNPNSKPSPQELETRKAVCTYDKMQGEYLSFASSVVAQFDNVSYTQHGGTAITFDSANGLHGAFMQGASFEGKTLLATAIGSMVDSFVEESSFSANVPLGTWSNSGIYEAKHQVVPDHLVQRLKYAIFLKEGESIEGVRDAIAAVLGGNITPAKTSTKCAVKDGVSKARLYMARSIHADNRVIYSIAIACDETASNPSVATYMDDVLTGTMVAPNTMTPFKRFICQSKSFGDASGMIDFIWIVDNSGSMADELDGLSKTAKLFQDRLTESGVDFRVGLAHTDSYAVEEWPDRPILNPDGTLKPGPTTRYLTGAYPDKAGGEFVTVGAEIVYQALKDGLPDAAATVYFASNTYVDTMGLRLLSGKGMTRNLGSFAGTIKTYAHCKDGNNSNICGYGYEDGFRSGSLVLERLQNQSSDKDLWCYNYTSSGETECAKDPQPTSCTSQSGAHYCMKEENHDTPGCKLRMGNCSLREGALKYIIWVSDEESRQFKEDRKIGEVYSKIHTNIPTQRYLKTCLSGYRLDGAGTVEDPYSMYQGALPIDADLSHCNPRIEDHYSDPGVRKNYKINENTKLADIKEQSPNYYRMLDYQLKEYRKYAGSGGVAAFALVGDNKALNGFCEELGTDAGASEGADYGLSYIHAARFLSYEDGKGKEGGYASICNTNYEQVVNSILEDAIGRVASHPLKGYPISSTIRVAVSCPNKEAFELKRGADKDGWNYDASQNAIVFSNLALGDTKDCNISIAFVIWTENKG